MRIFIVVCYTKANTDSVT